MTPLVALVVAMAVHVALTWDPVVFVCESDGAIVPPSQIVEGQRVDDIEPDGTLVLGCFVHRMRLSDARHQGL